ncbi:nuclear transport factor 2 family protein [Actinomadura geliboluensis]|uniref:Nuclear transport factor 2 family protein n=1 Tax=Actinomadura geliboluensis TaxID=882440 RepID=A0A5S4FX63_9ACTN|nr:nuclear transport factor 2 family protein [Actinomadura geliboluensis]TMR25355.1 nuclear transport factor 2 family protein [Actinomadura geliboluensis]
MDYDLDIDEFGNRYIAVWNEPDPDVRHNLIAALWDDEAVEFTDSAEYRGLPAIEARIAEAHEHLVKQGGFTFRAAEDAVGHHGTVRFTTYMTPAAGGGQPGPALSSPDPAMAAESIRTTSSETRRVP